MLHSAILNTAFTHVSNAVCKDEVGPLPTICAMHDSMARLYEAAKQIKGVSGQTALATLLSEKPQTVNNWETRGISAAGALKAQAKVGCDAVWLVRGIGGMVPSWPFAKVPIERFLALAEDDRGYVQRRLLQAIEECERVEPGNPGPVTPLDPMYLVKPLTTKTRKQRKSK